MSSADRRNNVMKTIYERVNSLLGAGAQLFSMQFPAQPLNYHRFMYDTSNHNSLLQRPTAVAEAEFQLSDQLFDTSPITQGPNGQKLSVVYETLLNNYIPKLDQMAPFIRDRAGIASFLTADSGEIDEEGNTLSRIELAKKLYQEYLEAKNAWEIEKQSQKERFEAANDLDGYAHWLSHEGIVQEEILNNLYNDVVIRGHFHEVMSLMGYLNVSSASESLEVAKQHLRHSASLALDESMIVYPVTFQPTNWYEALAPNLNPTDLTMSKDALATQLQQKRNELARLKTENRRLELMQVDPDTVTKLENEVASQRDALDNAEAELIDQFGEGAVTAAKIYLESQTGGAGEGVDKIDPELDRTKAKELGLSDENDPANDEKLALIEEALTRVSDLYKQQKAVLGKVEALTDIQARLAHAQSHNFEADRIKLRSQIESLEADIQYLGGLVAQVHFAHSNTPQLRTIDTLSTLPDLQSLANELSISLPANSTPDQAKQTIKESGAYQAYLDSQLPPLVSGAADNLFMDVVIRTSDLTDSSSTTQSDSATKVGIDASFLLSSISASYNNTNSHVDTENEFLSQEMEIGFRVAKVTFDRGGWFNPQFFHMSHAFYRLADIRAGAGLSIDKLTTANKGNSKEYLLPAFPTGMVIAKDITIRIKTDQQSDSTSHDYSKKTKAISGGFLCFTAHGSKTDVKSADSTFHGKHGDYFYIKIPGPQILGYFLEFLPEDQAEPYRPLFNRDGTETDRGSDLLQALQHFDTYRQRLHLPENSDTQ